MLSSALSGTRLQTLRSYQLPQLIGIGPRKCGTDWLDSCLREHPAIYLPENTKELFFFDRYYGRGLGWYARHFKHAPTDALCGEVTPSYWSAPAVPERIREALPSAQLVTMLRDPVWRAWSSYLHYWRKGDIHPNASFHTAVEKCPEILDDGLYDHHLARWLATFPRAQIKVLISETTWNNPQTTFDALFQWLGIDPILIEPIEARNRGKTVPRSHTVSRAAHNSVRFLRSHDLHRLVNIVKRAGGERVIFTADNKAPAPAPDAETIAKLESHYRGSIAELSEMLGEDMNVYWADRT